MYFHLHQYAEQRSHSPGRFVKRKKNENNNNNKERNKRGKRENDIFKTLFFFSFVFLEIIP